MLTNAPGITKPLETSTTIAVGNKLNLSIGASNFSKYQWRLKICTSLSPLTFDGNWAVPITANGIIYTGVNTPNLIVTGLPVVTNYYEFQCVLTSSCTNTPSYINKIKVYVNDPLQISARHDTETGVSELMDQSLLFKVYPNPSLGIFELSMNDASQSADYTVFTIDGKVLRQGEIINGKATLNLTDTKPGMYFIKLLKEKEGSVQRLIEKNL